MIWTQKTNLGHKYPPIKLLKNTKHWQEKDPTKTFVFAKQVPIHPRDRLARKTKDEVKFIKQVFLHPRERFKGKRKIELDNYSQLSKKRKNNSEGTFIKQVPIHPHPHPHLEKLAPLNGKVQFVKQVPVHPHDRLKQLKNKTQKKINTMKSINAQIRIAVDNTNKLMLGEFDFTPSQILNKTFIFDTLKIDEENIIDRKIDTLKNKITMNIM